MGYSNTSIVHWGVELTMEETIKLHEYLKQNDLLKKFMSEEIVMDDSDLTEYPCIPNLPTHLDGIEQPRYDVLPRYRRSRFVHCVEVRSDETDSRIESNHFDYEEDVEIHYFGIYCGSKGYAYTDDIKYIMKNIPQKAKDNFDKYCKPILQNLNINKEPEVQIFNQVW